MQSLGCRWRGRMRQAIGKSVAAWGCVIVLVLAPAPIWAQDEAGIAGAVTDETAGRLPGVTVEVQGPTLLASRTGVTDLAGLYRIIALPAGTYSVTFTLLGFKTVVREDVVLAGAFVANVDQTLPIGELSEAVRVSGAAPLVDVVSTRQQTVLTAERINVLPGSASLYDAPQYVPGVRLSAQEPGAPTALFSVNGSDMVGGNTNVDGIKSGTQLFDGTIRGGIGLLTQEAAVAEFVIDTSAQGAEFAQSGVRINLIPKSGGNQFSGQVIATGGHETFISDNLSQELKDQGFRFAPQAYTWDINPAAGGPIKENTLWWFGSFNGGKSKTFVFDTFYDPDEPTTPEGQGGERAFSTVTHTQEQIRVTHQVTQRHKLTYSLQMHERSSPAASLGEGFKVQPEAFFSFSDHPTYMTNVRWTAPLTSRLLLEATASYQRADVKFHPQPENPLNRTPLLNFGQGFSGTSFLNDHNESHRRTVLASVSYVTGSHTFKGGLNYSNNVQYGENFSRGDIRLNFLSNGRPLFTQVTNGTAPGEHKMNCDCGLYVQDSWTMDRLTLNLGARYDWFINSVPAGTRPAGFFVDAIEIVPVEDTPNWRDFSGRLGAAFDLFSDGRTALKATAGRYVANHAWDVTFRFNPNGLHTDTRRWTDLNGDGTNLNLDGTPQFEEIGPSFNPGFGAPSTGNRLDPNMPRDHNWEYTAGIEHELNDGMSVSVMYYRRHYSGFSWNDDLRIDASDYEPVTFPGPTHPLLVNGGGEEITAYQWRESFDNPFSGAWNTLTTLAPENFRTYNGFEVIADGRLPRGGFFTGSFTTGQSDTHFCQKAHDDPNVLRHCNNSEPFRHMFKVSGAVPLPYDTMISGIFQVFPGESIGAMWVAREADVGQPIRNCCSSFQVDLLEPNTLFGDYSKSLTLRFSKVFTMSDGVRSRAYLDARNLFNRAAVTQVNQGFGEQWLRPQAIQEGRTLSFGLQVSF